MALYHVYRYFEATNAKLLDPLAQNQYRRSSLRLLTGSVDVGETRASAPSNAKKRSARKVHSEILKKLRWE